MPGCRSSIVRAVFSSWSRGRALDRAGVGETVRVMNLDSRVTVTARMGADGMAHVSP
ncbi:Flagellar basal body P-ring biosynthesis protein [Rubellimicrobium thermophilum DSM 16684]|uniref:Flagellar basal body P-ring biosynthesis protein n=1 Tax=Rubellimicrobium thermophilum DSM 16684 TaxID=1123069 RepID=S9S1R8_9RHOB|nr:Flagellar basal body P-ring biosynthesis protein [Rubellimicrobium thermophilum DSM 16684]